MLLELTSDLCGAPDEETGETGLAFGPVDALLKAKLRAAGLEPTSSGVALGRLLFLSGDRHVTRDMLWSEASALGLPLTRSRIADVLQQLVDASLLREVALYGATVWYDTNTGPHSHFYDEDSQMLYDMPEHMIPQIDIARINLPASEEIDIVGVDLIVRIRRKPAK